MVISVAKKKVKRKLNKKACLVMLLTLYLIIMAFYYCFNLPIKNIVIKGNNIITDDEILEVSNLNNAKYMFKVNSRNIKKRIETLSIINDVTINKSLSGKLELTITEKKVLYYSVLDKSYILEDGTTMDNIDIVGVPLLVNYIPSDIKTTLIKKMNNINYDNISLISEIEYSPNIKNDVTIDGNRFLLRMNDGNIVYINLANFDKMDKYMEVYATLNEGQKGVIYFDSSSERVVFQPFELIKKKESEKNELSE